MNHWPDAGSDAVADVEPIARVVLTCVMRASPKDQTGNTGETEVTAKFERLGWGVAPNPRHDLGTDLWLMARDERLFDLGLVVGAQVKTGPSYFDKEERDALGVLLGWWFRDSDRSHIDAWAFARPAAPGRASRPSHGHFLLGHVVTDAVVSTGVGAKILVPAGNVVDEGHRKALLEVAANQRSVRAWEGSAWTGAGDMPAGDLLRHALIVPRLVAPHPNAGQDTPITPAQAMALLVQARLADLRQMAGSHRDVPSLETAAESLNWGWRFVGAMGRRLTLGERDSPVDTVSDAPDSPSKVAATVAAAAAMLEDGLPEAALVLLEAALDE